MNLSTRLNLALSLGEPSALPQRGSPFSSSTRLDGRGRRPRRPAVVEYGTGAIAQWVMRMSTERCVRVYRRLRRASAAPDDLPTASRRRVRRRTMAAGLFLLCADEHGLSPLELHALLNEPRRHTMAALGILRRRALAAR